MTLQEKLEKLSKVWPELCKHSTENGMAKIEVIEE